MALLFALNSGEPLNCLNKQLRIRSFPFDSAGLS
jgi:hypothetical protein